MIGGSIGEPIGGIVALEEIVEAVATAGGVGGASATSVKIIQAIGTAAGVGGASATSINIIGVSATVAGVGTAAATSIVTAATAASAAGASTAAATSTATKETVGSAPGVGGASATSTVTATTAGSAAGIGGAAAVGQAIEYLRPDGDTALDGWTDELSGTTNIYQSIDEVTVNDADYVKSPSVVGTDADLKVRLFEGSTQIVEWTHTNISATFTDATQTLTAPQFAAITDFDNLFAELDDNQGAVYRFSLNNPAQDVGAPVKVMYRYKKLADTGATTIFTATLTSNDTGAENATSRTVVPVTAGAGTQIRVTFEASSAATYKVDNASIGISIRANAAACANNNTDSETTGTPTELLFSGVSGFTLTAGQTVVSDWVNFSGFTATSMLVVVQDISATGGNIREVTGLGSPTAGGTSVNYTLSTNSYNQTTAAANGLNGRVWNFNKIEVQ